LNDELGMIQKAAVTYFEIIIQNLLKKTEEKRIPNLKVENPTQNLTCRNKST